MGTKSDRPQILNLSLLDTLWVTHEKKVVEQYGKPWGPPPGSTLEPIGSTLELPGSTLELLSSRQELLGGKVKMTSVKFPNFYFPQNSRMFLGVIF